MKVYELIEALRAMPQDAIVVGDGFEGGLTELKAPTRIVIVANGIPAERQYWGEFDETIREKQPDEFEAVYLERGRG